MRYPLAALVFVISTTGAGLASAQNSTYGPGYAYGPQSRISIRACLRWPTRRMGPPVMPTPDILIFAGVMVPEDTSGALPRQLVS
jgi:hypothetical protein